MRIDDAITELNALYRLLHKDTDERFLDAILMGKAALMRLKKIRPEASDPLTAED